LGLFKKLRPVARAWIVFHADPSVGEHQLEGEEGKSGGEPDAGKDFHHTVVGGIFVIIFLDAQRGSL
jgi:hypothetical protein